MRTHLLIMNGPERRDRILEKTIQVSEPIFDVINIVQNGYVEGHVNPIIDKYITHRFKKFIGYVAAYEILIEDMDDGDYFLILDSDEIPSTELLDFIKKREFGIYDTFHIQFMHHQFHNDGTLAYIVDSGTSFAPHRFFMYRPTLQAKTHDGAHQMYHHANPIATMTNLHINHIKHDFALLLSHFAHGVNSPESVEIRSGMEYDLLTKTRDEYKITPDVVYKKFNDKIFFRVLLSVLMPLSESSNKSCGDIIEAINFVLSTRRQLEDLYSFDESKYESNNHNSV